MAGIEQLAEQLVNMTVKEVNELAGILKEKYGIEPAAAAVAVAAPVAGAAAEQVEEKTAFDVILKSAGAAKLKVIKAVKDLTGSNLTDAKVVVEAVPKGVVKKAVSKEEAESLKKQLEEAGAEVELA